MRYARSQLHLTCRTEKRHVTIRIQDDGDGIAAEDLPHIFDRFYMGKSGKSGIGLALTREIIQTIRGGSNNLPEEIVVYDDRVTGRTNGVTRTYDFIANRVATLQRVYNCMLHYGDYELLLRPQVALGNAINRVLGGEYDVSDEAVRRREQHAHSDGEIYFLFHYTSDHVLLRLKPKTYF